jgi:hypothetical protein
MSEETGTMDEARIEAAESRREAGEAGSAMEYSEARL